MLEWLFHCNSCRTIRPLTLHSQEICSNCYTILYLVLEIHINRYKAYKKKPPGGPTPRADLRKHKNMNDACYSFVMNSRILDLVIEKGGRNIQGCYHKIIIANSLKIVTSHNNIHSINQAMSNGWATNLGFGWHQSEVLR